MIFFPNLVYNVKMSDWIQRLRDCLAEKNMSAAELARRSGVPKESVYKYLQAGIAQPRGDTIDRLAKVLEVDRLWLKEGISLDKTGEKQQFIEWIDLLNAHYTTGSTEEKAEFAYRTAKTLFPNRGYRYEYILGLLEGMARE